MKKRHWTFSCQSAYVWYARMRCVSDGKTA